MRFKMLLAVATSLAAVLLVPLPPASSTTLGVVPATLLSSATRTGRSASVARVGEAESVLAPSAPPSAAPTPAGVSAAPPPLGVSVAPTPARPVTPAVTTLTRSEAAAALTVRAQHRRHREILLLPRPYAHEGPPSQRPPTALPSPAGAPTPVPAPADSPTPTPAPAGSPVPAPAGSPSPAGSPAPSPAPAGSPSPTPAPTVSPTPTPAPTPPPPPQNQVDCRLVVPADPLTAQGLATPWQLTADDTGPCHEANLNQSAFVQAAVLNRGNGQISVYSPLVIDQGSTPAIAPTLPVLPANAIVGIWVGFNGNNLTLVGPGGAACVNGADGSNFGQNAFCNATAFFAAAYRSVRAGKLRVPALGTARDGQPCPTTRDFSVVDQDQSDNTTTVYLATADGRLAQDTPQNAAQLQGAQAAKNGSDEGLLNRALDGALGCTPWTVPDLADPTGALRSTAWPLTEIMAAVRQAPPVALVPAGDPFVIAGTTPNLQKLNAYRAGVGQPQVHSLAQADTAAYCRNLLQTGLPRLAADRALTSAAPSPFPDQASNLFTFLAMRFAQTFSDGDGFLHCQTLLGVQAPVTLTMTAGGVVTDAAIDLNPPRTGGNYENDD